MKLRWRSFDPTASLYSQEYSKEAVPGWANIKITEWRLSNVTITQRDRAARNGNFSFVRATFKLERDSAAAMSQLCAQAQKALTAHSRERDDWKAEADRAQHEARKLKDRLEEMAYKVNGLAAGAL